MFFRIDTKSSTPLYEQIIYQIKDMCLTGLLRPGEKLPSIRDLSSQMVINPNTVNKAYQELERSGIIVTIRGKGTFIAEDFPLTPLPEKEKKIQSQVRQLVIDCHYAGISKQRLLEWTEQCFAEMEDRSS
ncbi:GntR family transcriptional regulator [Alkalicoccus halolimnae]|uniref:GntR family transcriptional regulator n=1 Tax=Alkalicoccus halolimnae TaxID=1667239 RepID=A0A5C7FMG6_9BACI|nr:GntR family transcriptional regulator [Alkalicoccus halolimnae]TXF86566.1 GntR family transcriptional regulator [Alkalicoccus halolimnae]